MNNKPDHNSDDEDISARLPGYYFSKLIEIWIHRDQTFWTSVNVFLVVQGILFVALFQSLNLSDLGSLMPFILCALGVAVSIMWLIVAARAQAALILMEHAARHLEKELFAGRFNDVTLFFPMYFWGSRAVFRKGEELLKDPPDELSIQTGIKNHHLESLKKPGLGFIRVSSFNIMAKWIPILFIVTWISVVVLLILMHIENLVDP